MEEAVTCSRIVAVSVTDPAVPVITTVEFPGAAVLLAVKVNTALSLVGFCEKLAVTPLGRPEIDRLALTLKPCCGVIVMV